MLAAAWMAAGTLPGMSFADEPSGMQTALEETKQYFTAPVHWDAQDWTYFGISAAAVAAAHALDSCVRSHFATGANEFL